MATMEMQLISRIVRLGVMAEVKEWGITRDDYLVSETKGLFGILEGYYAHPGTAGSVPGPATMQTWSSNFQYCDDPNMTTAALCDAVRRVRLSHELKEAAQKAVEEADLDPVAAAAAAQSRISEILQVGLSKQTDVHFSSAIDQLHDEYRLAENGVVTARAFWPWPLMNEMTGGLQPDDYIVLYGRPKSMKSWVLSYMMARCFDDGANILVYTKEMTPINIYKRIAACLGQLPYQELRRGRLDARERATYFDIKQHLGAVKDCQRFVCLSGRDVSAGGDTVGWIQAKAEKYRPDVIFIDGMYLLASASKKAKDHERVMEISRAIRQMSLSLSVPVVATMQANRKAAGHSNAELDEIAYSDAIGQDATVAIRVINEKTKPTIALVLAGSREFELHGLRIHGVPATNFTFEGVMSEKEIKKAQERDATSEDAEAQEPQANAYSKKQIRVPGNQRPEVVQEKKLLDEQMRAAF